MSSVLRDTRTRVGVLRDTLTRSVLRDTRTRGWVCGALLALSTVGCEDEVATESPGKPAGTAPAAGGEMKGGAPAASASAAASAPLPVLQFTEADFVESDDSRDPFRTYELAFVKKKGGDRTTQRKVKAGQFALDELKLVGIITRSANLVMLQDPTGFAWSVTSGEYVGKAEMVSSGAADGEEIAVNWRVDRIRPTDVVFIREDTAHPEIAPTTRVLPLYADETERPGG